MRQTLYPLLLSAILVPATVAAEEETYFVAGVGMTTQEASEEGVTAEGDSTSFRIGVGTKMQENIYVEGYYINFGTADDTVTVEGEQVKVEVEATAIAGQVVGMKEMNSGFSIFGKLGMAMWDGDANFKVESGPDQGATGSDSDDGTDIFYGFGVEKSLGDKASIRVEYEMISFDVEGLDVDGTTIGVMYRSKF